MLQVKDMLNKPRVSGDYAFEVEVTGGFDNWNNHHQTFVQRDGWKTEEDGSIGGGIEFVFSGPATKSVAKTRIENLYRTLSTQDIDFSDQDRAGVHLHVNVQDWTIYRLMSFVSLYYIFEDVLLEWCGDMRAGNHFCLRMKDAEYLLTILQKALSNRDMKCLSTPEIRYAALNFNSIFKYGSLELRSMRTSSDPADLVNWMELVDCLVQMSANYSDPLQLVNAFTDIGNTQFIESVFKDKYPLLKGIQDLENKVRDGVWIAQDIAFATHWKEMDVDISSNPFREVFEKGNGRSNKWKF